MFTQVPGPWVGPRVRDVDSRPKAWVRCSMSPNTSGAPLSMPQISGSVVLWAYSLAQELAIFPPFSSLAEIVEVEIEVVLPSIVPSGKFHWSLNRTVTCMVLKANDRRTFAHATMKFRGLLVLTTCQTGGISHNTTHNNPSALDVCQC
ncbi:hypothetical protein TNCV_4193601 [Trichonephila clavipes]|nr:hypothetical protein TNCV_4193601 [Trichonephila clavipes]